MIHLQLAIKQRAKSRWRSNGGAGLLSAALLAAVPPAGVAFGATAAAGGAKMADDARRKPENVYFTLNADGSKWATQQVNVNEVKEIAENIAK